jgi:hypothetical protein
LASKPPIVPSPPDRPDELVAVGRPATLSGGELDVVNAAAELAAAVGIEIVD